MRDTYHQMTIDVLKGKKLASGHDILEIVASGHYLTPRIYGVEVDQTIRKELTSIAIQHLWDMQWTYIVRADAPLGCEQDTRQPTANKFCLESEPKKAFWLQSIGQGLHHVAHKESNVFAARGLTVLRGEGYNNVTINDVLKDSMRYYSVHKNKLLKGGTKEEYKGILNAEKADSEYGVLDGIFHVAVCDSPDGAAVANINQHPGRNYPCVCGKRLMSERYEANDDETHDFLQSSGLYGSHDFHHRCGDKCEKADAKDQSFEITHWEPQPKNQVPWEQCKYTEHPDQGVPKEQDKADEMILP